MQQVIFLVFGAPGTGKSVLARKLQRAIAEPVQVIDEMPKDEPVLLGTAITIITAQTDDIPTWLSDTKYKVISISSEFFYPRA